jgi:hypothetical protein
LLLDLLLVALGPSEKILQVSILRIIALTSSLENIAHIYPVELGAGDDARSVSFAYKNGVPALLSLF